jgi:c-di-GMP-binding flagellar brake protein YcgR
LLPKVNDLLYIQVAATEENNADKECKSRIADVQDDFMLIEVPIEIGSGRVKRLYTGDELSIYFLTEGGVKNYFNTYVLGFSDDVIHLIRIRKPEPENITKIQRRQFLRVTAKLEIAVQLRDGSRFIALTDDVGGGGLAFRYEGSRHLVQGEGVYCWLLVPYKNGSIDHVPFEAELVRTKKLDNGHHMIFLKFTSISDMERQKLIRYCFERQFDFRNR